MFSVIFKSIFKRKKKEREKKTRFIYFLCSFSSSSSSTNVSSPSIESCNPPFPPLFIYSRETDKSWSNIQESKKNSGGRREEGEERIMILLNKTGEKTEEDQATDPRARRSRPGCGASSSGGGDVQPCAATRPTNHPPTLSSRYEIYVWKYSREHYACRISRPAAGGPPVTTLRRKMYFSARDGGGKVEIRARTTLPFSRAIRFLQVAFAPRACRRT